jgi:type VI secretion system protein ImpH
VAQGNGQNTTDLIDDLVAHAPEYDFFQAVYRAELLTRRLHPERRNVGLDQKGLAFRPYEQYSYPPTDIRACHRTESTLEFVLNFMGLYGINSPLPRCYHEHIVLHEYAHGKGHVPLQDFFDIFNNRFYWLYYQAWKKYRYHLQLDEPEGGGCAERVLSFVGGGSGGIAGKNGGTPLAALQFSGIFASRVRGKSGLRILLRESFPGIHVAIEEFVPQRTSFAEVPLLGRTRGERSSRLGNTSVVGRSAVDRCGRICVELGPMPLAEYLEFLPGGDRGKSLHALVDWYLHDLVACDVQLLLESATIVPATLGDRRVRLGSTAWLRRPAVPVVETYVLSEEYSASA